MLPADLKYVHSLLLDGVWHTPVAGTLTRDGTRILFLDTNGAAAGLYVETDAAHVTALLLDVKKRDADKAAEAEAKRAEEAKHADVAAHAPAHAAAQGQDETAPHSAHATHGHRHSHSHKGGK